MFFSKPLLAIDHPYLKGKGGRLQNNSRNAFQGLTKKSMKHHKAIQPLFIIMGFGVVLVIGAMTRIATMSPEINWSKSKDPANSRHFGYYKNRRHKMIDPKAFGVDGKGLDYKNLPDERKAPDYRDKK